ncbi:GNAT family N-acetyltransferase [Paenibacillus sp. GCM10023250]|uniref:GNAT family N-acetyltransferase n=1 Tax=Paenibacillus sp. GCM10023250 TaxID=3252648 RepID=UPI00361A3DD0
MNYFSKRELDRVRELEHVCRTTDGSSLRVGVESLKAEGGDEAHLCLLGGQLIGFLSWYTSDGTEANVNGMVHPGYRRRGVWRSLLRHGGSEMEAQGIRTCRVRVPADSEPGTAYMRHLGAEFREAEYVMALGRLQTAEASRQGLRLRLAGERDWPFIIACSSLAFGDSESWTREYFARTREPGRDAYVVFDRGDAPIGLIRVNHVERGTGVIHDFCVLPSCQGRGYGREILELTVRRLLEQGCDRIRLNVVTDNGRALGLYRSVGFEVQAEFHYYGIGLDRLAGDRAELE